MTEIELTSAEKPKRKYPGSPFTKENAKAMQLTAAKAKKMRKEARAKMLAALTTRLDLGDELYRAMLRKDEKYLSIIERATRLVGLLHDQSPDAIAQKISLDARTDNRVSGNVNITVKGLDVE